MRKCQPSCQREFSDESYFFMIIIFCMSFSSVVRNRPFFTQIVLRIPEIRSNDFSSILHTRIGDTYQKPKMVCKAFLEVYF